MYQDITIDKISKEISKLGDQYQDGLINDINYAQSVRTLCSQYLTQEVESANDRLKQLEGRV